MEKCFFLFLALSGWFTAASQSSFGLKGGIVVANIRSARADLAGSRIGWNAGMVFHEKLGRKMLLHTEAMYILKGYRFSASPTAASTPYSEGKLNAHYLSLHLLLGYRVNRSWAVLAGPEISYLYKPQYKFETEEFASYITHNYKIFDAGLNLGCIYSITRQLAFDLRFTHGITKAGIAPFMAAEDYQIPYLLPNNPRNYALQAGVLFILPDGKGNTLHLPSEPVMRLPY